MRVVSRASLVLVALAACAACGGEKPVVAPALVRVDVTPQFGVLGQQDPEANALPWKRAHGVVLGDCRSAHALQPGVELLLPIPAGAAKLATACAARLRSSTEREGQVRIAMEIESAGRWNRVGGWEGDLARLLDGWTEIELPLDAPTGAAGRLRVRAELTGAAKPDGVEVLVQPLRALAAPPKTPRVLPNVLVISIDTLRADHLSCYGYARPTSPRIDALAKEGVLFEHVVAAAPWTLPSYGSLFTACTPAVHRAGVNAAHEDRFGRDEDTSKEQLEILRTDLPTLAEQLGAGGFASAGFQANSFLRAKNGVDRGFDRWVFYQYHAPVGVDLALDWIESHAGAPWFCFLHIMDVHQPYVPPPPFDRKFSERSFTDVEGYPPAIDSLRAKRPDDATVRLLVDEYDGAIAYTDQEVGRLLDRLQAQGLLDSTLVVVHADHGEEFWEHGGYEHGHTEYTELLSVPLILRLPGKVPAGKRVASRVRLIDLMPTVLDLLHLPPAPGIEGRSLLPLVEGRSEPARECISEATLHGPREIKALTVGADASILRGGAAGLFFDLAADPAETKDLSIERRSRAQELEERLLKRHEIILRSAVRAHAMQLTDADRKRLREMGYTEGADGR
jgi:arylsulfatase A-like enzyme